MTYHNSPLRVITNGICCAALVKKKHKLTRSSEDDVKIGSARLKARHPLFLFLIINLQPALMLCQGWLCSLFFALGAPWAAIIETSGYI